MTKWGIPGPGGADWNKKERTRASLPGDESDSDNGSKKILDLQHVDPLLIHYPQHPNMPSIDAGPCTSCSLSTSASEKIRISEPTLPFPNLHLRRQSLI
jgi:hypothetical protein